MLNEDYGDLPKNQILKLMDKIIENGMDCYIKWTCICGSRQTCDTKNAFFTEGYKCEECKNITFPDKFGLLAMSKI